MAEKYATHNVHLESADFSVLIIEFPEEDVNDKLSLLSSEKGLIYRHFYEDFIIGTCMANTGPFFYHIRRRPELLTKFSDIRKEALELVYQFSPGFRPENIFINQNNVLKTKSSVRKDEKVRPLIENGLWDQDPPLSSFGPTTVAGSPVKDTGDLPFLPDDEEGDELGTTENPFSNPPAGDVDAPYELIGHRWEREGLFLNVRKYEEGESSLVALLGGTPFESSRGYHLLIVQRCIEDFADVFQLLDEIGVSKKTPPATLVEDLYNIAISYNPFLKLEEVDLKTVRRKYKERQREKMKNNRQAAAAAPDDRLVSTGKNKRFADVPKEKFLNLATELKSRVVGQDEALVSVAEAIQRAAVGLKRAHEPVGVFLFTGNTGVGKCLAPGTEVLMYNGTVKVVEEVVPGDLLMGPDSLPRQVVDTCSGEDHMFEIVPTKGNPWVCNAPHVLTLVHTSTGEVIDMPLNEYLEQHKTFKHLHKLFRVPVNFEDNQQLPLDPYFVGLWFGDGKKDLSSVQISNTDDEIISYLSGLAEQYQLLLSDYEKREGFCPAWALTAGNVGGKPNVLLNSLRGAITEEFGLAPSYKVASEKERLALLAGFIDADGSLIHNCYEISQKNPRIAKDFAFVARSVGFMVTESIHEINGVTYQRLFISGDTHRIPVKVAHKKATHRNQIKNVLRTGFKVKPVGKGQYFGFTLSGDGRFLLGDFTVTHNTETAKALADVLDAHLVRIDCQEYQQPHEPAKLTGSPPGYVGYEDGGHLTKEVSKNPFSVVLFDEVEKAHSNFHERVLQLIDDGVLTDNKGKKVPFNQTIIIMTSNIGVKEVNDLTKTLGFGDVSSRTDDKSAKARESALKDKFKPEFLNRIDDIVHFRQLERKDYLLILDILLKEVGEQVKGNRSISITVNAAAKEFLLDKGIDKKFGARPLRRAIKKYLNTPLAQVILTGEAVENSRLNIGVSADKDVLVFKSVSPKSKKTEDA